MKKINIKQLLGYATLSLIVSACAEYDVKEDTTAPEAAATKTVVVPEPVAQKHSKESVMAAISEAKEAKKRAEELGGLWRDTSKLIKKAEDALSKNNNDKAYNMAVKAKQQGDLALNQSYLEIANHKIGQAKELMAKDDAKMLERINEAESAYLKDQGEKAYAMAVAMLVDLDANPAAAKMAKPVKAEPAMAEPVQQAQAPKEAPKEEMAAPASVMIGESKSEEMQLAEQYTVVSGDSLWGISKKPEIYNNPYQWPLIYKANRDQINDPDMIVPGMLLAIDRAMSEADINAAIMHARTRGEWTLGGTEASDQAYLDGN